MNAYKGLGDVCFEWFYHLRPKPVAPYYMMIEGYSSLSEEDQESARIRIDEMFTDDEVKDLFKHLEEDHGIVSFSIEKVLPVEFEDMVDERGWPRRTIGCQAV